MAKKKGARRKNYGCFRKDSLCAVYTTKCTSKGKQKAGRKTYQSKKAAQKAPCRKK